MFDAKVAGGENWRHVTEDRAMMTASPAWHEICRYRYRCRGTDPRVCLLRITNPAYARCLFFQKTEWAISKTAG